MEVRIISKNKTSFLIRKIIMSHKPTTGIGQPACCTTIKLELRKKNNMWNNFFQTLEKQHKTLIPERRMLLFSRQVVSDSSRPHGLQHVRPPCPSPSPRVCPSSCPLNQWCHPTIWSSVTLFSFYLRSFPASGSFPVSQLFASGGQRTGVSASTSVLPKSIQGWFPLRLTGLISLLYKGLSRVFSRTQFKIL